MKQAVAALAARRHALAQHQAGAPEGHDLGLAPRRVMEGTAASPRKLDSLAGSFPELRQTAEFRQLSGDLR